MIEQTYFLDMVPCESTPPVVHVSQFDVNSRTLTFNLMKGGVAFVPDAGMSVTLDGMKPDNHVFSYPMTVNGSSVSIDVLTQMTVVSGHVRCEVSVSNQNGKIGSANFILAVEESPIDSGTISESDIPIFEDLKNQAQQAAADAEQSASDAESAASSVSSIVPSSAGTTGQVLTKTATGADWKTPTGGQWGGITGNLADQTDLNSELTALNNGLSQKVSSVNGETPDTNGNVEIDATKIDTSSGVAIKSVSGNPVTIADALQGKALGVTATLEPIQDLHGYDKPWAGGIGKNKLENVNTTQTINGVTFTVNLDGSITANGTATDTAQKVLNNVINGTLLSNLSPYIGQRVIVSGCPSGGSADTYRIAFARLDGSGFINDYGAGGTVTVGDLVGVNAYARIQIERGVTANNLVFKPMIRLATETDPTYEPYSNICPITGRTQVDVTRTGVNVFDEEWESGYFDISDGSAQASNAWQRNKNAIRCLPNTAYCVKQNGVGGSFGYLLFYDTNENYLSSRQISPTATDDGFVFTTPTNANYIRFYRAASSSGLPFGINYPSTDRDYHAYEGDTYTTSLGQTVYGGTLDVTTGLLTVDKAMVDLGTLDWSKNSNRSVFQTSIGSKGAGLDNIVCSNYRTVDSSSVGLIPNGAIRGHATTHAVYIHDDTYASIWDSGDTSAFKTAMSGVQLCYELETPQTIQLTPAQIQLLTTTNIISTNADDLSVRYYATGQTGNVEGNLSFLLDKTANNETAVNTVSESIAPTETGTATQNYATGSYLMLNNRLCKVTAAIATGEQIIVGSNVQYTTVAEELTAILAQINA